MGKVARFNFELSRKAAAVVGMALLGISLTSCGGSGNGPTGPIGLPFVFDITNIWFVENDTEHEFNLFPTSAPSDQSGTFEGEETLPGAAEVSDLSGSYTGFDIRFTVERAGGDVAFSGRIINANRMEVTGGGESLVIVR